MRLDPDQVVATPWKNGGGLTRELALHAPQGRFIWRLSLADIQRDGPFSPFPGLARIHTIVTGKGLRLGNDEGVDLLARPQVPLVFDGGLALTARLRQGPCRALNLIYDPTIVSVVARVLPAGPVSAAAGDILMVLDGAPGDLLDLGAAGQFGRLQGLVAPVPATGALTAGTALHIGFTAPKPGG